MNHNQKAFFIETHRENPTIPTICLQILCSLFKINKSNVSNFKVQLQ